MKKLFRIFLIITLVLTVSTNYLNAQENIKSGYYYLAETSDNAILIKDIDSDKVFGIEKIVALGVIDFKKIKINSINAFPKPIETIQVTLTNTGFKKWNAIQKRCTKSGESVVLVCENKIYGQYFFNIANARRYRSKINLCIPKEKINHIFSIINTEMIAYNEQ